ncbi:MAG: tetratricopeptide repeat protein [Candidatus Omnitrophica bacterium]|nr:tetratricopeptide repeat protein [Candidatus Omnitrophota bacterium]
MDIRKKTFAGSRVALLFLSLLMLFPVVSFAEMTINDAIEYYDRGKREFERNDYDDAIEYFNKAVNDAPENAMTRVAMYYLAKSYQKSGETGKAEETFKSLIDKYGSGNWVDWAKEDLRQVR